MMRWLALAPIGLLLGGCLGLRHPPPLVPEPSTVEPAPVGQNRAKTAPYEVFGEVYYPITDAGGYRERGVASWYGGKFHGRNTANGERYDMHRFTAAHKTLPLPTWVRVTNLRNGATVTVRVNDRGPFVKNRLIDLSYAAARQIGMVEDGTTLVEVEAIGAPAATPTLTGTPAPVQPRPAIESAPEVVAVAATRSSAAVPPQSIDSVAPPAAPPTSAPAGAGATGSAGVEPIDIYVQVGAFGDRANAERVRSTLYNAGIAEVRLGDGDIDGLPVHRVQIGPVRGVVEYDTLIARLESLGIHNTHLVTEFLID